MSTLILLVANSGSDKLSESLVGSSIVCNSYIVGVNIGISKQVVKLEMTIVSASLLMYP